MCRLADGCGEKKSAVAERVKESGRGMTPGGCDSEELQSNLDLMILISPVFLALLVVDRLPQGQRKMGRERLFDEQ